MRWGLVWFLRGFDPFYINMFFLQIPVGTMDNFVYLVGDEVSKECAVIDCGFEAEKINEMAKKNGYKITYILLTHVHYDHSGAAETLAKQTGAQIFAHNKSKDKQRLNPENGHWIIPSNYQPLKEGDHIHLGNVEIKVFEAPGHQNDHLIFQAGKHLFTGDTLFIGRCGRVDLPDSNPQAMQQTLKRISSWEDDLMVCPGHDYGEVPLRTLKEEKMDNAYLNKNLC